MTQPPIFNWATAVGGTVIGGLTLTAAEWIENISQGLVAYGVIEYSCSGSPDLSGVLQGHRLVASGFSSDLNNGTFPIQSVNNSAKTIRVLMTARSNAGADETGASASGEVITSGALLNPPTTAKRGQGYVPNELPNALQLNWLLNNLGQWTDYLTNDAPGFIVADDLTALAAVDTTNFVERGAISIADGLYTWLAGNTLPVSSPNVIDSDVSGQWVRRISSAGVQSVAAGDGIDVSTVSGTATVSVIEVGRANYAEVNQSEHGFVVGDVVRHNGTTWVKAQGNTIANSTNVWTVVQSVDANNFVALKEGRVTVPAHGLGAANTLLYLSAATAGATTSTKPVGSNTQPLGFFLPVIFIESTNVIHVLGKSYPEINPVLARYLAVSAVNSPLTFSGLNLNSYNGQTIELLLNAERTTNDGYSDLFSTGPALDLELVSETGVHTVCEYYRADASTPAVTIVKNTLYPLKYVLAGNGTVNGLCTQSRAKIRKFNVGSDNRWFVEAEGYSSGVSSNSHRYKTFASVGSTANNLTQFSIGYNSGQDNWHLKSGSDIVVLWDGPA